MEIIIYSIVLALAWILSCTLLLPLVFLLKFNRKAGDIWFSFIFSRIICPLYTNEFKIHRKNLFKLLEDHLQGRNKRVPLELLEIGPGSGPNLQFYPENSNLTALDMNESFLTYFRANMNKYPKINSARTIVGFAENMSNIADGTFDAVVSTHVLCSVRDVKSVLKEVKRVLKPGGKYIFMEHVAFPSKDWKNYAFQNWITPLWKIYTNGCYCNRNIADFLNKAGFSDVLIDNLSFPGLFLAARPHISGIATK